MKPALSKQLALLKYFYEQHYHQAVCVCRLREKKKRVSVMLTFYRLCAIVVVGERLPSLYPTCANELSHVELHRVLRSLGSWNRAVMLAEACAAAYFRVLVYAVTKGIVWGNVLASVLIFVLHYCFAQSASVVRCRLWIVET